MKIVIAPDSFKESLSAMAVADAIEAGFKLVLPDATYVKLPMADGGTCIVHHRGVRRQKGGRSRR